MQNRRIQVIGTHLQNDGDAWLKHSQSSELYHRLIRPNETMGVPQIVCGDFNISRYDADLDYRSLLRTLDAEDGEVEGNLKYTYDRAGNDLQVEPGHQNELIDYVLLRPNRSWILSQGRRILVFQSQWHLLHKDLSDHYSVEAQFSFREGYQSVTSN